MVIIGAMRHMFSPITELRPIVLVGIIIQQGEIITLILAKLDTQAHTELIEAGK
jgi:hypothetical protein